MSLFINGKFYQDSTQLKSLLPQSEDFIGNEIDDLNTSFVGFKRNVSTTPKNAPDNCACPFVAFETSVNNGANFQFVWDRDNNIYTRTRNGIAGIADNEYWTPWTKIGGVAKYLHNSICSSLATLEMEVA